MRGVDIGSTRDRQLEAVLRPLLLGFRVRHADADDRPRATLPEILRLREWAHHVDAEEHCQETTGCCEIAALDRAMRQELGLDQRLGATHDTHLRVHAIQCWSPFSRSAV